MRGSDALDCLARDPAGLFPNFADFRGRKRSDAAFRIDAHSPQNFVGHPVADSGEGFLHQQGSFDGNFFAAREKFFDEGAIELGVLRLWRKIPPPRRGFFALMKLDASELARIVKDQRALLLEEDEMIVFAGREIGGLGGQFAGHAEMHAEPSVARESKEHAFAVAFGFEEFCADQRFLHSGGIDTARDALLCVDVDARDRLSDANIPASPVKFDFRQFGHDRTASEMAFCRKSLGNDALKHARTENLWRIERMFGYFVQT